MATIKDLAEQYGLEDYEQLLGGYPNATKFANALQSNIESHIPTTEDLQSPERMGEWSLAAALNQPTGLAIKGYHGSPHKFKEFDTAHMGTGEGGQAYGWGNYITEDPYVATTYSPQDDWMDEQLMNLYNQAERRQDYPSMEVYERYMMHERPNEVKDYLKESYADYPEDLPKRLPAQKIGENLYKKQKGSHLYEVSMEFPKEREAVDPMSIEHFLDYDKPLSEQSDYVRNILQRHDPDMYHPEGPDYDPTEKGNSILQRFGSGKEGAQKLYELGIPGTTYMGEKAKVANPEGVRNFVTYSDEVPRVVTRNMNKVKPLTDEDRLNDLEKQMSAYMKTKRMPKGVDFKTESDWYDWAYDKRDALRQKVSNENNPPVIPVSNNKNYDLIKKYLSEGKLSPDDMAQYEQNALAMETPLLQRYNVENAEMQIPNTKQRAKSLGFMTQPSKEQYHLTRNDWENNIPDLTKSDLGFHTGSIDQANYRGKVFDDNAVGQSVIPIAPHKYTNYLKLNDLGSFHADAIAPQLEKKKMLAKGKAKQIQSAIDNDWKLTDQYDQQMRDVLSQHDIDAIKYANEQEGEGLSYAHINPSMIRSRFAAFDPLRKNSSSIMASGLLGDLALKYANDEEPKYAEGGSVDKDSLQLNKPQRTPSHPDKSHIVKTMVDGKEKIIRFGEQGAETAGKPKEGESDRMTAKRESFKARHAKNIAKGPSSAAYWANKVKWAEGGEVDIRDDEGYADDLARLKRAYENSNFGPNDSMIASTIRHPAEAVRRAGDWLQEKERILSGRPYEDDFTPEDQALAGLDIAGLAETGSMPFAPISAGGTLGTVNIPEKTVNAYKLFRTKANDPDTLYPLFVNADKPVLKDEWIPAEAGAPASQNSDKVKSLLGPLAYRPGWHAGDVPVATHIGKGGKPPVYRPSEHTWAEVEFPDDIDWQTLANERGMNKKGVIVPKFSHITDQLPEGGFYRYKTSPNMTGQWLIGGSMKLGKHLSDDEVKAINEASGLGVEDLPRFHEYLSRNADNPSELSRVINSSAGKDEYFQMLKNARDNEIDDLLKRYSEFTDDKALSAMDKRYNKYLKQGYAEGGSVDAQDDEGYLDDLDRLKKAYERSNFGPNDSVIASTIHHPIEAAKRAKDSLMRSIDTAAGVPREILDESSAFPFGIAPSMDEQAQAGLDLAGLMQTGAMPFAPESAGGTLGTLHKFRIGDLGYDLRFDDRKLEQDKLQNMVLQLSRPENEKRIISLANYEGYPWVTSMSDRTNVGNLHYINDRPVDVDLQGGQDYMFNNPGQVWASAQAPVNAIMKYGKELSERAGGLDPLYMPWRMAPTGGDYANMTGETMLKYMRSNMNKKEQRAVNKGIKDFIPDFKGIESEEGIDQFRNAPDKVRKALKNHLDTKYRNAGGISIGEARLAVADPSQLLAPDTGLQNVGQIYTGRPIIQDSGHRAYPKGVPGQGLGVLDRDVMAYDLMPDVAEYRGLIDLKNPRTNDIRALQMKPYGGIITDKILKNLGYAKGGEVKDLHNKYEESDYGYGNRPDKTKKGLGYFGELERPDGTGVMTEYSIGVPIHGEEMDVPTLVPTLTPDEIRLILHMQDGDDMPRSIVHKAIDHAHQRLSEGKPIFATEEDLYAHGGIVDVLHNDAIEQIMKAFMDSMADDEEPSAPAVSIEITTQNTETPRRGKIPKSIAREAKHG